MRKFLTALIVIPLGLILVAFAVANRHFVRSRSIPSSRTTRHCR